MSKSSTASKPSKPYPEFPLFPHATRRWAKKIRGKLHYFGPWADPDAALQKYLDQRDDLHAGRTPRQKDGSITVADMANHFLAAKHAMVASGDLAPGLFLVYHRTARRLAACFGRRRQVSDLRPSDFAQLRADMAKDLAPSTLTSEMSNVSSFFRLAVALGEGAFTGSLREGVDDV